jgi:hypothetical protein
LELSGNTGMFHPFVTDMLSSLVIVGQINWHALVEASGLVEENHTNRESPSLGSLGCRRRWREYIFTSTVIWHRTEFIMEDSAHKPKSGSVDSIGRRCMMTPKNSFEGVESASIKGTSQLGV